MISKWKRGCLCDNPVFPVFVERGFSLVFLFSRVKNG